MRDKGPFWGFLKKEDDSIIERITRVMVRECEGAYIRDSHITNLNIVYRLLIDENKELSKAVFSNFLNVLAEMGFEPPEYDMKGNRSTPWYPIPSKKKDLEGYRIMMQRRMNNRAKSLERHWEDRVREMQLSGAPLQIPTHVKEAIERNGSNVLPFRRVG